MKAWKKWLSLVLCIAMTLSLVPVTAVPVQAAESDIVLHYDFENIENNIVPDTSGNGFDGTINSTNAAVRTGIVGSALDIGSGHVKIPAGAIKDLTDVTVVAQVYIEDSAATATRTSPTTMFSAGYGNKSKAYFMINTQSFNLAQHNLLEGCGYTIHTQSFTEKRFAAPLDTIAVPGQWNTVAMTQSGTTVKFYLNGELIFTKENVTATMGDVYQGEDTPVLLGGSVWNDAAPDGWYDSFTIYNRALDADELPKTDLVLDYQFEGMSDGDTVVTDASGNDFHGTLNSSDAKVVTGEFGDALDIGAGHVSIPAAVLQGLGDVTVLAQVYIEDSTTTANRTKPTTMFSAGYNNKSKAYFMLNTQSFNLPQHNMYEGCGYTIHTPSFYEKRFAAAVDTVAVPNQWNTVAMTQSGTTVKFYLNGELIFTKENVTATMGDVYQGADTPVMLGGSVWNDLVPDGRYEYFRIYNRALSADEIPLPQVETPVVELTPFEKTCDYITRAVDYLINDGNALPQSKDEAFSVEWSLVSGDAKIVDGRLCKTETSAERQPVVLEAVVSGEGESKTLTFENVTLIDPYAGYILSFFGADGVADEEHSGLSHTLRHEKFRMAYSYDGIHWAALNNNFPVLYNTTGNGRLRDPAIMRNKDGSFTVLSTQGWDTPSIYLWHSDRLTEFTNERLLTATKAGVYGLTGSRAWAPEGTYDPITDLYYIYWSDPSANGSKGATYYNTSEDLESLSEPGVLFDPGYRHLDANIIKYDGTYYLDFRHYTEYNVEGKSGIRLAKADHFVPGEFEAYTEDVNPYRTDSAAEGSFMFKVNGEDKWYLYWDYNDIGKFGVMETTDLDSGEWTSLGINPYMPHTNVRHGGCIPVTQKELDAILAKWNPDGESLFIAELEQPEGITVEGTVAQADLKLPETVQVILNQGEITNVKLNWSCENYKAGVKGEYTFVGTPVLENGLTNPNNLTASMTVKNLGAALEVIDLINAIGEVTLDSGDKIDTARTAYDALPEEEVPNVTNYETLIQAELKYAVLVSGENADDAEAANAAAQAAKAAAEAAQKAAEDAQTAAEAAQSRAEAAQAAAEEAQKNAGDDAAAAEAAKTAAENAKTAAEAAQKKAEAAQTAAENAKKAAEDSAKAAAQSDANAAASAAAAANSAAAAAKDAAASAKSAEQSAASAAEAAQAASAAQTAQKAAEDAQTAAEAAQSKAEAAQAAAEEAQKNAGEDAAAAEAAKTAADTAKVLARAAQKKAEAAEEAAVKARQAAEEAALAAAESDVKAAQAAAASAKSAVDAATEAAASAKSAEESAGYAAAAAQSARDAQAAKAAAEEAKAAAQAEKEDAEAAKSAAEAAQTAAEAAKKAAEDAQALAEAAQAAAQEDQLSAEAAMAAAEAARIAAEEARAAVEAEKLAVEEAKKAVEESQQAVEEATLNGAKIQAALNLDSYAQKLCQTDVLAEIVTAAKEAIEAAESVEEVQEVLVQAKNDLDGIAELCPSVGFADVVGGAWYHDYVDYMIENGYMKGVSATEFDVNGFVTRGQLVTILYRIAGEPSVEGLDNPFEDVQAEAWYTNAVIWAANAGVVKGMTENEFAPNAPITREQIVTIVHRYDGEALVQEDHLAVYSDAETVSGYAYDAMNWAIAEGVINGMTETTLAPTETATRAQICAIVMRYLER